MTFLVQQRGDNDCVLASLAMAKGVEWGDLWTQADLDKVSADKGVGDIDPWMKRLGWVQGEHYMPTYCRGEMNNVHRLLWKRRALLSVSSLNNSGGSHMVFWDGDRIWDPHEGHWHLGHQFFRHLSTTQISQAFLLLPTPHN